MTWVRFHGELRQGEKRAISKASRFIYMELSHEARPRKGIVVLPPGMSDVDAVREIVGGTRREVAEAIRVLSAAPFEMIQFEEIQGKRVLIVVNWEKWNPTSDDSAPRVRAHRAKKNGDTETGKERDGNTLQGVTETTGNGKSQTLARARALLSSPSDLHDLPEGEPGDIFDERDSETRLIVAEPAERYVRLTDTLPAEMRETAGLERVQDIEACWKKFKGFYADQWINVPGKWLMWCVEEARRERTARDRQARLNRPDGPIDPSDPYHSPEARKAREDAEQRRRDAEWRKREAEAVPIAASPVREIIAMLAPKKAGGGGP